MQTQVLQQMNPVLPGHFYPENPILIQDDFDSESSGSSHINNDNRQASPPLTSFFGLRKQTLEKILGSATKNKTFKSTKVEKIEASADDSREDSILQFDTFDDLQVEESRRQQNQNLISKGTDSHNDFVSRDNHLYSNMMGFTNTESKQEDFLTPRVREQDDFLTSALKRAP